MSKPDKRLTFKNPGIDIGDSEEGDLIEVVAELRVESGDRLCFKRVNGIPLDGYREEPAEDDADMGKRVMGRMEEGVA